MQSLSIVNWSWSQALILALARLRRVKCIFEIASWKICEKIGRSRIHASSLNNWKNFIFSWPFPCPRLKSFVQGIKLNSKYIRLWPYVDLAFSLGTKCSINPMRYAQYWIDWFLSSAASYPGKFSSRRKSFMPAQAAQLYQHSSCS